MARKHTCVLEVCVREDLAPKTMGRTSAPYPGGSLGRTRALVRAMAWGGCGPRRDAAQPASRGRPLFSWQISPEPLRWVHRGQQTRLGPWDLPLRRQAGRFGSRPCERERDISTRFKSRLSVARPALSPRTVPCSPGFLCDSAVVNVGARVPAAAQARSREAVSQGSVMWAGQAGGRSTCSLWRDGKAGAVPPQKHGTPFPKPLIAPVMMRAPDLQISVWRPRPSYLRCVDTCTASG